jgi:diguanylate cyclase (GGDEF)-like protein/PAS domain S-box-containing protein
MMTKTSILAKLDQLRVQADARLAHRTPIDGPTQSAEQLLHELHVHEIELEMQNEELQRAYVAMEESRDRYADLYEFAPVGYLTLTCEGLIDEINLTGSMMLGVERKKLMRRRFSQFVSPEDGKRWTTLLLDLFNSDEQPAQELALVRSDGNVIHVQADCHLVSGAGRSSGHAVPMLRIALTDVTAKNQVKQEQSIAAIAFNSQEGMFVTDAKGIILRVNDAWTDITGYSAAEAIGQTPSLLKSGRHNEDFYTQFWASIHKTGRWCGEIWNRRKNGEVHPEWQTITAVTRDDGVVTHYVGTLIDITLRKNAADEIKQLAFYDSLTLLPNRRLLLDRLHQAMTNCSRSESYGALLFLDLDNFKTLNDTMGHDTGDLLLVQVAQRLQTCVREGDTVARLGGDEFVVMLEGLGQDLECAADDARAVGEKVIVTLNVPYQLGRHDYHNTSSIGITLFNAQDRSIEDLLKRADIAMYESKKAGGNILRFFDPEMQTLVSVHAAIEKDLRHALLGDQFVLYFQMQVRDNQILGAEALLRWRHPQWGLVSPLAFIPLAEKTGLILPIGQWVLDNACAQLKMWEGNPLARDLQLSVNVSARQFHQPNFVELVHAVLKKHAVNPKRLKLELTESVALEGIKDTIVKMQRLKEIGVCFSLDDFGTGYSSLTYLTQLPLDQLKIDQSFVHNIGIKPSDAIIIQTIIGMANNLGIEVIAEGVEVETQRAFLAQFGCPTCQGFLFGEPIPLGEFELLLV